MRTRNRHRWTTVGLIAALLGTLVPLAAAAQPAPVEDPADACPNPVNPPSPFTDRASIPRAHVLNVDCAFNERITLGYTDGTFGPQQIVTRDQFASFLVRTMEAADVDLPAPRDHGFTDIRGNVHEDAINVLAATGITTGVTATRYQPGGQLRRDQVGSFILRAVAYIEDVPIENLQREDGPFTDVRSSSVHAPNINGARVLNLTIGRTATTFDPDDGTTRAQMASFLVRLLAALSGDTPIVPDSLRATALSLTPATSSGPSGSVHTVTATAEDQDGVAVTGAPIRIEVYRDDPGTPATSHAGPREVLTGSTDGDGQVVATYTGPEFTADDVLVGCVLDPERTTCQVGAPFTSSPTVGARVDDTATRGWVDDVTEVVVDSDDLEAINPHGTDHTVDVTAQDQDGAPVSGAPVRFEVYRDDATTPSGVSTGPVHTSNVTTGTDGRADFTYTGPDTDAVDTIVICRAVRDSCLVTDQDGQTAATQFSGTPTVAATPYGVAIKRWEQDPFERVVTLDLDPEDASNHIGTDHTVTATAADGDGAAVTGSDVRFEVYRDDAEAPVTVGRARTDAAGEAVYTYDGPTGTADDVIVACPIARVEDPADDAAFCDAQDDGRPVAQAVKRWRFQADAGAARAAAVLGEGTGTLVQQLLAALGAAPEVEVTTDGDPRQVADADELLVIPANPLLRAGATEVDAAVDLDEGEATGIAQVADVELLGPLGELGGEILEVEAIRSQATAACPTDEPFDSVAARQAASEGTSVVGLAVLGNAVPILDGLDQVVGIPEVLTLTTRQVEATRDGDTITYTVRGLVVDLALLDLTLTFGETEASILCTATT